MKQTKGDSIEQIADPTATYGGVDDTTSIESHQRVKQPELLTYMADLLDELRSIADQNDWRTLSGLLALSHAEAMSRQKDFEARPRPAPRDL